MNESLIQGIFSILLAISTYLIGRRMEKAKIGQQELDNVKTANEMIVPLLQSSDVLAKKVNELRIENESARQVFDEKIGELENEIKHFKQQAEKCTCGAFPLKKNLT
jgi:hypothetical protein